MSKEAPTSSHAIEAPELRALDAVETVIEVLVTWGDHNVIHAEHLRPGGAFWAGEQTARPSHAHFPLAVSSLGTPRVPIVACTERGPRVFVHREASCEFSRRGRWIDVAELGLQPTSETFAAAPDCHSYALPWGEQARVKLAGLTFLVRLTHGARAQAAGKQAEPLLRPREHRWTLASLALHVGLLILFSLQPPRSLALSIDRSHSERRLADYLLARALPPPPIVEPVAADGTPGAQPPGPMPTPTIDEGSSPPVPHRPTRTTRSSQPAPTPAMTRDAAKAAALRAGIIGQLREGHALLNDAAYPSYVGAGIPSWLVLPGESGGRPGLSMIGSGRGQTDGAGGTVPVGALRGPGVGGHETRFGNLRPRASRGPQIRQLTAEVRGSLGKDSIRRTIQRHLSEVRHCYSEALLARPDLQGRVVVHFAIAGSGEVMTTASRASDPSLNDVARCIATSVRRWHFSAPPNGGIVTVQYPFVLQLTGG